MYPVPFNPHLHKVAVNPYVVGGLGGAGLGLGSGLLWYYLTDQAKRNALTQILLPTLGGAGLGLGAAGLYDYFFVPKLNGVPMHSITPQNPAYVSPDLRDEELAEIAEKVESQGGDPAGVIRPLPGMAHSGEPAIVYQEAFRGLDSSSGKKYGVKSDNPFDNPLVRAAIDRGHFDSRFKEILDWAYINAPDLIEKGLEQEFVSGRMGPLTSEAVNRMTAVKR